MRTRLIVAACFAAFFSTSLFAQAAEFGSDVNWKAVLMTGDDSINAFDNARKKIANFWQDFGVEENQIKHLSRMRSQQTGGVMATSVANFQQALEDLDISEGDGCVVFMTSHGTRQGFYIRGQSYLTPSRLDSILDATCGLRPTVVLISACYSGVFVEPLQADNRIILTAARSDRTSFGCSSEAEYTYWDGCVITELPNSDTWNGLYEEVKACIKRKEMRGGFTPSHPQGSFGSEIADYTILDR